MLGTGREKWESEEEAITVWLVEEGKDERWSRRKENGKWHDYNRICLIGYTFDMVSDQLIIIKLHPRTFW